MTIWDIGITIYAAITLMALFMTAREHYGMRKTSVFTLLGYIACTVWPLTLAGIFVAAQRRTI
jgi:hypothetical protein